MITTNVISRTFHIRWRNSIGTAFTIDHRGKQYLITARHVVEGMSNNDAIAINHGQEWKNLDVRLVGTGAGRIDAAVLSCAHYLSPPYPLEASTDNMLLFQQVYFLGFPFGWTWTAGHRINNNYPVPFAKTGILSASNDDLSLFYIDGHNNPGFSGGPVVFRPNNSPSHDFKVAGIVSGYHAPLNPIVDEERCPILNEDKEPFGYTRENTGFVVVVGIRNAIKIIDENPIGFELPD